MAENRGEYWIRYRAAVSRDELAEALALLRPNDPELFLPKSAPAPLLFQCARFDMDDVRRDCEAAYHAAGEPKVLRWYDVEHHFADFEASLDRMRWLADNLKILAVHQVLKRETQKLRKE